jgi:CRP-like cAMP-binding protein
MPGDPFGEVSLLLGSGNPLSVIADEDCTVC